MHAALASGDLVGGEQADRGTMPQEQMQQPEVMQ
jgi:hypothetical protein